jgi:Cu2+-containing amine oxidase
MAFIDRIHSYLPGWEMPQMRNELFTDHYGFVVDYLAEALREMRKHNFTETIDRHWERTSMPVTERRSRAQPTLSIDEQIECEQAVLSSPAFRAALEKQYGITDTSLVMVDI